MNLSAFDLNLLLALEALVAERSVTRAAERVGLSQPAMSNALARLRRTFGDPLLVRRGRGMAATSKALQLAAPVGEALAQLRAALGERPQFDPRQSARTFNVLTNDFAEMLLVPLVLRRFSASGGEPSLHLRRVPELFRVPEGELQQGIADGALGFFPEAPSLSAGIHVQQLFEEEHVCIARRGHPRVRGRLTLRRFAELEHTAIFYQGAPPGLMDKLLAEHGLKRSVRVVLPHFSSVPHVVAATDLIATFPRRLAQRYARMLPLQIVPAPVEVPPFRLALAWHDRAQHDPAQVWLREQITEASKALL